MVAALMIIETGIYELTSYSSSMVFLKSYHFSWFRLKIDSVVVLFILRRWRSGWHGPVEVSGLALNYQTPNFDYCCFNQSSWSSCFWCHCFDILTLEKRLVLSAARDGSPATKSCCDFHITLKDSFSQMTYWRHLINWNIVSGGSSSFVRRDTDSSTLINASISYSCLP